MHSEMSSSIRQAQSVTPSIQARADKVGFKHFTETTRASTSQTRLPRGALGRKLVAGERSFSNLQKIHKEQDLRSRGGITVTDEEVRGKTSQQRKAEIALNSQG